MKRTQARIPINVYEWLSRRAIRNDRSINAELVRILKELMELEEKETLTINN